MKQLSRTPDHSTARYPFHQNDAVRPPRKRKQNQNENQFSISPKVTTKFQITTVSTNRRSNSVQTRAKQPQTINTRNVKIDRSEYQHKMKIQKLWKVLSQNLRRSKQRIELFHSSRKIHLVNIWKSLVKNVNRRSRIYDLKVKIFKSAFIIVNQILSRNRIQIIPTSYVSNPLLNKLNNSSVRSVLSELIRLYYSRRSNKERVSYSVVISDVNINIEMDTLISRSKMYELVREAFINSPIEVRENDIDEETAGELIPVINFNGETMSVSGNTNEVLSNLTRLTRKDIRMIVNDRIVSDLVQRVYDHIDYPITLNNADDDAISSITSFLTIEDSLSCISQPKLDSIFDLTQKDMKIYVNKRIIDNMICHIIDNINIPIEQNTVGDLTATEIVENDVFDDVIESHLTIPYINKDYEIENNQSKLIKMLNLTPVDVRMYFSGTFVDDMIDSLYDEISNKIPLTSNIPSEETCREIIDIDEFNTYPFGDYIENSKKVAEWVDPVSRYETKDIKLYVNKRVVSKIIGKMFSQIKNTLPIVPNTIDQSILDEIVSMPIEDSLASLPFGKNQSINSYQAKDIRLYVNGRIIDGIISEAFSSFSIPIIPNRVTKRQVNEILEDDFQDIMPFFSNADDWIDSLLNVDPNNRKITLNKSVVSRTVNSIIARTILRIPIISNDVDDETIDEILDCTDQNCDKFEKGSIQKIDPLVNIENLYNIEPKDMRVYVSQRDIDDIMLSIFDETSFPLASNDVNEKEIEEIANANLEDAFLGLPIGVPQQIDIFQPKDIQIYVNERIIDDYMYQILENFKLPLTENEVAQKDIDEILEDEDYMDGVPPMIDRSLEDSLLPLFDGIDPFERRINFNFPINSIIFAREAINHLPICPNEVNDSDVDSILTFFDDKITFKRSVTNDIEMSSILPLNDTDPLQRYIAPDEICEPIDEVVERVMNRILVNEIFPAMPLDRQVVVENDTANAILSLLAKKQSNSVLIDQNSIFKLLMTKPKTIFNVEPLKNFDIIEQPITIEPDDILNGILWHEVLQKLPLGLKKKKIVDFYDVVDEIVLDNYVKRDAPGYTDSDNNRSVKSNRSSKSSRSKKSNNELINNILSDVSDSYEIEENLPYLITSPSNPSSPTSPASQQQYFKSYLDSSSESFVAEDDKKVKPKVSKKQFVENNNNQINIRKEKKTIHEEKIIVDVEDTNNDSISFSFEGAPEQKINVENVEIENVFEEEEEEVFIENLNEEKIIQKKNQTKFINFSNEELIIEEEEDKVEVNISFDVDANDDSGEDIKFLLESEKEEEDHISDLLSDEFSD